MAAHEAKEGITKVAQVAAHEAKVGLNKAAEQAKEYMKAPHEEHQER